MGLFLNRKIGGKGKLSIWHISESVSELLGMSVFREEELLQMNSFSRDQRKKEWLISRMLIKKITRAKDAEIIYDDSNKPFLKNSKQSISISHSHNLLAVVIDDKETGIDIECIKPNVLRIKEKFMSDDELKAMGTGFEKEKLTLYWCAKESLYKLYGKKKLAFKQNLFVEPFEYMQKGIIIGKISIGSMKKTLTLHYEKIFVESKEYMMAYVVNGD